MFDLIVKDFKFTRKPIWLTIVYCLAIPPLLVLDGGTKLYFASFFIPYFTVSMVVGKICAIEDTASMRTVIKLLPYSSHTKIAARYFFMLALLSATMSYLVVVQYVFFESGTLKGLIKDNFILAIVYACYFSIYLLLYYSFGYLVAQNSIYVCIGIAFIGTLLYEKTDLNIDFQDLLSGRYYVPLAIFGVGIIFLMFTVSCVGVNKRDLI
ncbi:ABC-2 transporter permease [Lachnospiraceae bacterium ZAX-1]